ncbi:hypothetical protein KW842_22255 [Duganella sp. sic0402]|uniref:hypothetical protein n=1 Tax=Duganella sp. sic0402 TaxID=2854786 RepID=UPI001C437EB1|nr:hypothetical protein [Duganella sp. sic0402]MBV7538504.1 hypothetical protein [Duganella sp. sic0402]
MTTVLIDDDERLAHAADFLNVSTEYLQHLLDQGQVSMESLTEYKEKQRSKSQHALQQLVTQAQELNMGY